ncbi:unnamed protein product [Rotaria sp. Silwood1]|nr:unnamed protein product [Rotaria sp. Silwood1]CAF4802473.1 unnamed protein product [Rotaria sp. Silwood1]
MTVCIQKRDRCRLCFSLILRDRSTLFSSICCQKYYHLFKHIKRTKIPMKKINPYKINLTNRTVCFRDLILRYLHIKINPIKNFSNIICYDCSIILLDIEQCAKYLHKTIKQFKIKFNKTNRLITSSLSATFQKKNQIIKNKKLSSLESDDDEEFDNIDDDEESDEENDDRRKSILPTNRTTCDQTKSLDFNSSSSFGGDSLLQIQRNNLTNKNQCNGDEDNDIEDEEDDDQEEDDEEEEEEEEEIGLISSPKIKSKKIKKKNLTQFSHKNIISNINPSSTINSSDSSINLLQETNPNLLPLRLAHMMANAAAVASFSTGQNNNNNNNTDSNNVDTMMNTFANMQRNFLLKILSDPMAAAMSATQMKTNISPISLIESNNKQSGSGRKRKSTPEKRIITNYRTTNNNGDSSPTIENESISNLNDNISNQDRIDHPLELTLKSVQSSSNRILPTSDVQNLVISRKKENGSPSNISQFYPHIDEDHKEGTTPNDSSVSLSSSLNRHSTLTKRQRLSTSGQYDSTNIQNNSSLINISQTTNDLLSSNHHQQTISNDDNNLNIHQRQQQRKLDPRTCTECGKVLFSDKTLLLHCQTHAKNEKQCWICGINDDSIKKHIINEHGNQKITNTGFKCQHCDKVFPVFADLENHTKEHSKKKPFECPICNKRFGQQGNLSCHLRIHSGVKPFTCSSCGKAFRHSNSLRRHARTVHSASRGLTTTNSLLLPSTTTSLSNDIKGETYDDAPPSSSFMIPSDDNSSSTGGIPSPSISNAQVDSDSHEQSGTN